LLQDQEQYSPWDSFDRRHEFYHPARDSFLTSTARRKVKAFFQPFPLSIGIAN